MTTLAGLDALTTPNNTHGHTEHIGLGLEDFSRHNWRTLLEYRIYWCHDYTHATFSHYQPFCTLLDIQPDYSS